MTAPGAAPARIRTAGSDDLDAIMALEHAAFGASAWQRDTMRAEVASEWGRYIVAVDDADAVVGYAGLRAVGVEGDVQTIAVEEGWRGRGLGRALLAELLAEAARRGVQELFLEVRADNPVARALYESTGFREIGVRPGYYQPEGVDAVVMKREAR
ncbi:ribosomal protein S18-alanine N-acetyltransferase [Agrococcus sp. HG114]|uniref:ribosomal protein S18-alanine N-acetyltransferase n=1 Tax=Agrococcus sp. HG114 TaxID=2969757 RepID=UPI00215AE864|nr:ribosomal protein S18-alanine N-acetyltransferase [Agrococcus sp. HG114]MCR8670865.1 ribosomal protein S18-alanine N-acetyltransferase [Agrococcus sp. HG114]